MLRCHVSGLPVLDADGTLLGMVSEGDFLHRSEIGTGRKRSSWLEIFVGPGRVADDFVHEHGRKVEDVMTCDPVTVEEDTPLDELVRLMETHGIKRLPVMRGKTLVGIVTRSNVLQAVASLAREIPDPTADDNHIRKAAAQDLHNGCKSLRAEDAWRSNAPVQPGNANRSRHDIADASNLVLEGVPIRRYDVVSQRLLGVAATIQAKFAAVQVDRNGSVVSRSCSQRR